MNVVEFQTTIHNGMITLPDNQQAWNGKKIKVILLDEASSNVTETVANEVTSDANFHSSTMASCVASQCNRSDCP